MTPASFNTWSGECPLWDPATNRVTFIWRAETDPAAVHLFINRITDKKDFDLGLMRHVAGTDLWIRTLVLPPTVCASYGFREYSSTAAARPQPPRHNRYDYRLDPHNPRAPLVCERQNGLSLLAGPLAIDQSAWETDTSAPLRGTLRETELAGRPGWFYAPPERPVASLWLFDAQTWIERLRLPNVLETQGLPMSIAGVAHHDAGHRKRDLAGDDAFTAEFLDQAAQLSGRSPSVPRILAGQSLGALASLNSLVTCPGAAEYVLAYSPSMWAGPEGWTRTSLDWITHRLSLADPCPTHLQLRVGAREPQLVGPTHLLELTLAGNGWDSELQVVDGGHDIAWWRAALIADIQRALCHHRRTRRNDTED
ncbi:enterochelin esterase domain-containing protein [Corynebacterium frankenforstense]